MEQKTALKIRSHNVNGFDSSTEFLYNECDDESFSILAIQEHWLRPSFRKQKGVNRLKVLHPKYDAYATSAMSDTINQRILKGRPFEYRSCHVDFEACFHTTITEPIEVLTR